LRKKRKPRPARPARRTCEGFFGITIYAGDRSGHSRERCQRTARKPMLLDGLTIWLCRRCALVFKEDSR